MTDRGVSSAAANACTCDHAAMYEALMRDHAWHTRIALAAIDIVEHDSKEHGLCEDCADLDGPMCDAGNELWRKLCEAVASVRASDVLRSAPQSTDSAVDVLHSAPQAESSKDGSHYCTYCRKDVPFEELHGEDGHVVQGSVPDLCGPVVYLHTSERDAFIRGLTANPYATSREEARVLAGPTDGAIKYLNSRSYSELREAFDFLTQAERDRFRRALLRSDDDKTDVPRGEPAPTPAGSPEIPVVGATRSGSHDDASINPYDLRTQPELYLAFGTAYAMGYKAASDSASDDGSGAQTPREARIFLDGFHEGFAEAKRQQEASS